MFASPNAVISLQSILIGVRYVHWLVLKLYDSTDDKQRELSRLALPPHTIRASSTQVIVCDALAASIEYTENFPFE